MTTTQKYLHHLCAAFKLFIAIAVFDGCAELDPVPEKKIETERVTWIRVWQAAHAPYPYKIDWSLSIDCRPKVSEQKIPPMSGSAEGGQWFFRWPSVCSDTGIEIADLEIVPSIRICDPANFFSPDKKLGEAIDIYLKCERKDGTRR